MSIQLDARWPASLPKTVGAVRRGVFYPLNYSGTLHQTPTIFPPSIPKQAQAKTPSHEGQDLPSSLATGPPSSILLPSFTTKDVPFREPIGQIFKIQRGHNLRAIRHTHPNREVVRCAIRRLLMHDADMNTTRCGSRAWIVISSWPLTYTAEKKARQPSYTVAGIVYRLECGADCKSLNSWEFLGVSHEHEMPGMHCGFFSGQP